MAHNIGGIRDNTRKCNNIWKIQDFWFWTYFQKIQNIPFQGDHSKFEFLECCLKNADIPRRPPPLGILHTLATEKFEFRVIALERDLLMLLEIFSKPINLDFRIFDHDQNYKNQTSSASIEPQGPWNHAHLVDLKKKHQNCGIETSVQPHPTLAFASETMPIV